MAGWHNVVAAGPSTVGKRQELVWDVFPARFGGIVPRSPGTQAFGETTAFILPDRLFRVHSAELRYLALIACGLQLQTGAGDVFSGFCMQLWNAAVAEHAPRARGRNIHAFAHFSRCAHDLLREPASGISVYEQRIICPPSHGRIKKHGEEAQPDDRRRFWHSRSCSCAPHGG